MSFELKTVRFSINDWSTQRKIQLHAIQCCSGSLCRTVCSASLCRKTDFPAF